MLLAYHREILDVLRKPTVDDPWRVLVSGCLAGWKCGVVRRYQKGVGVATALLLEAGIPVVSQRDFRTLALLRARLEPGYEPPATALDHHEHPWTLEHLPKRHPRA